MALPTSTYELDSLQNRWPRESTNIVPGRWRAAPKDEAPSAMVGEGSHHASSRRSVLAPRRIAVSKTSPVSPELAIDHSASFGWSALYLRRMAALCANPPAARR